MTDHYTDNDESSTFTSADRTLLQQCSSRLQDIYNYVFGSPENPNDCLMIQVDRNTRFRQVASKILIALIPTILMIIFYLFTNYRRS